MQHTPQRPFIPGRTPSAPGKAGPAAFKLARPFVHGVKRIELQTRNRTALDEVPPPSTTVRSAPPPLPLRYDPPLEAMPAASSVTEAPRAITSSPSSVFAEPESLAPIEQYLQTEPVYSRDASVFGDDSYELPPVEHFMDAVGEGGVGALLGNGELVTQEPGLEQTEADALAPEWGDTDWAQYDWRSAAALGEAADPAASSAWSETDWENASLPARDVRETAAKAIADALDGIARRIRDGELVVPSTGEGANPAAIAATLAALLGVKR
ncbi:MAG: hypothetical protein WD802_05150 [Gemmatimonadaceae bacterium]